RGPPRAEGVGRGVEPRGGARGGKARMDQWRAVRRGARSRGGDPRSQAWQPRRSLESLGSLRQYAGNRNPLRRQMKKTLQIVTSAYRCNSEEQDDPVVWICQAMKGAGADLDMLLEGTAVNYAVKGQDASGLSFGTKAQTQPPRIEEDLKRLAANGINLIAVEDDLTHR